MWASMPMLLAYSIERTAALLGISEEAVVDLVQSNTLPATYYRDTKSFLISQQALVAYLRSKRDWRRIQKILPSRVLIVDRNPIVQSLVMAGLRRYSIEFRVATESVEVTDAIQQFLPDVVAAHLLAMTRPSDPVDEIVMDWREKKHFKLVLFHEDLRGGLKDAALAAYEPDDVVSTVGQMSSLVDAIRVLLGLR